MRAHWGHLRRGGFEEAAVAAALALVSVSWPREPSPGPEHPSELEQL